MELERRRRLGEVMGEEQAAAIQRLQSIDLADKDMERERQRRIQTFQTATRRTSFDSIQSSPANTMTRVCVFALSAAAFATVFALALEGHPEATMEQNLSSPPDVTSALPWWLKLSSFNIGP